MDRQTLHYANLLIRPMVTPPTPGRLIDKGLFAKLAQVSEVVRRSKKPPFQVLAEASKPDKSAITRAVVRRMVNFKPQSQNGRRKGR